MYAPGFQQLEEDYFTNINYSKNIDAIIPVAELGINFRTNGLRTKRTCFLYAEKIDFKGLIQLRLTEKCDQRHMYISTVDSGSFQELKQDQSLHVTFAGFIENLVRLLQDCQTGKLEMNLLQLPQGLRTMNESNNGDSTSNYQIQFVEMRPFKNLIHLSLPCRLAPLNVVLFYMTSILDGIQKKNAVQDNNAKELQQQLNNQLRHIEQLNAEIVKLRENYLENTKSVNQRHGEEIQQMQESLRKASEQRHNEGERYRKTITTLQSQLEKLNIEKTTTQTEKAQVHKRNEILTEELKSTKSHISNLKEENEKLTADITSLQNAERKNEMLLNEGRKHIVELQDKINRYEKTKAGIVAELEAEKKITYTKRQALEIATEEISKANEIILKKSQELIKLKRTIDLRTEVALHQEKAINEKNYLLNIRDEEIKHLHITTESLRREIPEQLNSLRQFANALELKYTEQIQTLKEKLKCAERHYTHGASTQTITRL